MAACSCPNHSNSEVHFADYYSENIYTWCTNCGNYGIHAAIKRALVSQNIKPCQTLLCFDIGCHGNGSDKIGGYRFHGLHGRVIPFACGASIANSKIKVVAFGGDGGTFGEGISHLILAIRANFNLMFVFHNNLNYGLTKGQASATTKRGVKMNSSPDGVTSDPINPMEFVLSLNPSFTARTFSGNINHATQVFEEGLKHKGFAFIEVLQSCPTYNHMTPHQWYQERVKDIKEIKNYDIHNLERAQKISKDLEKQIAIGVLYKKRHSLPFMERQSNRIGIKTELTEEVKNYSTKKLFDAFR
ncbi:MAG: 2-oxoacid oxidoreductase, beta subunit [Candidatus Curtissbacteria bacterium GW2011_GWA1_40_9]|uniref:2-oxoacid oxidoreductase, beta subunit n=1 Tax=Candidatus Curtissbacteria bacterium GW2011_GWA1_40_9 TaxID=1618408 RepID=A0A0G0TMW0_9BACT|nr:MAG: 2-oxoacid oxidoreductase, beta subunit [Candidatus Curtissbacteria bacterium GW2011_GWA1_40_9]